MDKSEIINDRIINFIIEGQPCTYTRMHTVSGIPYYAPAVKHTFGELKENAFVEEALFFPVSRQQLSEHTDEYFFGFLYMFTCNGHTTLSLSHDNMNLGMTHLQLEYDIHRIRCFVNKDANIVLDKLYHPLFPTGMVDIYERSSSIGDTVSELMTRILESYCHWYLVHEV